MDPAANAREARPKLWAGLDLSVPRVMGILNVTPDSFSDGGKWANPDAAIAQGLAMLEAGADIVDIGGESTRPGAAAVAMAEEIARVIPVVAALAAKGARISVDTRNAGTMAAALDAGAAIINDISGLTHDAAALPLLAAQCCPVILMHMRGTPATMNEAARYQDVAGEVLRELLLCRDAALAGGLGAQQIALDPGFGFAKIGEQNLALLRSIERFAALGHPLVVGISRKRFIGQFGGEKIPEKRVPGSIVS